MVATVKTSIALPATLCNQADMLAQHLNISRNDLFRIAIENFIGNDQTLLDERANLNEPAARSSEPRIINQGDLFWVQLDDLRETEPGIRHPHVVIQDNVLNHSRIHTVVACALTTNTKRANMPGNVLLEAGEGNLLKPSVVEVSKVSAVYKTQLGEYIGSLSQLRIDQVLAGMRFLQRSFFTR